MSLSQRKAFFEHPLHSDKDYFTFAAGVCRDEYWNIVSSCQPGIVVVGIAVDVAFIEDADFFNHNSGHDEQVGVGLVHQLWLSVASALRQALFLLQERVLL